MEIVSKVISANINETALKMVGSVLNELDAKLIESKQGFAGSQDLLVQKFAIGNAILVIEQETYIGITAIGESKLIDKLANLLRQMQFVGR